MVEHGLVEISPGGFGQVVAAAEAAGAHVVDLSAEIGAHPSPEALADHLWDHAHARRTVVIWPGSRAFRLAAPHDYRHVLSALEGIPAAVFIERDDLSRLAPVAAAEVRTWPRIAGLADARPSPFGLALAELVLATGHVADLASEHGRWELYQASFCLPDLLRAAVRHEPDGVLAKAVVLAVLPLADDHSPWPEVVGDEYVRRRSHEIGLLRRAGDLTREEIDVAAWSDWLQLRLAETPAPAVLRAQADEGRTKRVRRLAFATLRAMPG